MAAGCTAGRRVNARAGGRHLGRQVRVVAGLQPATMTAAAQAEACGYTGSLPSQMLSLCGTGGIRRRRSNRCVEPRSQCPVRRTPPCATAALTITPAGVTDLVRSAVMLDRAFTETVKVDGTDAEVWLRLDGSPRATPKIDRHVGSAFLVADGDAAYLVTAAHVARRMDREARVSFAGRGGRRASRRLADVLSLGSHALRWTYAPPADVAAVRIPHPPPALRGRFLPAELLARDDTAPQRNSRTAGDRLSARARRRRALLPDSEARYPARPARWCACAARR